MTTATSKAITNDQAEARLQLMPDRRDRAAAVGVEVHELRRQAALTDDVQTVVPLKEADRALKRPFGRGDHDPGDSYSDLNRLADRLYQEGLAEQRVVQTSIAT